MVRLLFPVGASLLLIASAAQDDRSRLAEAFVRDLHQALERQDRKAVAGMVEYPLTVLLRGLRVPIPDAAALMKHYDVIFTPALRAEIGQAARTRDGIRLSADGVAIAGLVSASRAGSSWKVTRITVPARPRTSEAAVGARRAAARRVVVGTRPVQLSGTLEPRATDSYVVWVERGRLLEIRILGVPARTIVAHVLDATRKVPVDERARDGARVWTGRVADSADYLIEIVRGEDADGSALPYTASITVR